MLRTRVIPVLLLKDAGLVKTVKFKSPKYIGDPINAVRIFNEKEVDELVFLDISATPNKRKPNFNLIKDIASEAFMPFAYGGNITSMADIEKLFYIGVEKVIINSFLFKDNSFVKDVANYFGSQSVVAALDIKKNWRGKYHLYSISGQKRERIDVYEWIKILEDMGVGEFIVNSIDKDGMMTGYDIPIIKSIVSKSQIPVVPCGGAGNINDLIELIKETNISAVGAGSLFVYQGVHKAVLINYPDYKKLEEKINNARK